ncbi:outer membrane protein assembly factor BamA [Pelagibaculum spongiae]|uniref:Outer membrane protein assembly factor BamA n=1 Tax=Pelagibaculum spongiae TaxID=2080658 RepID=A0A2V1GPF1_9GAMM|nr:outer membrane protein assembly factor BamA [Pelagibaculum spongiae]PVZ64906.1 outer membrane protein assembly factor BamA [Pelagibaculum spongiae]
MGKFTRRLLLSGLTGLFASTAQAFSPFVVSDVQVRGLDRIPEGVVFKDLAIGKGDKVDQQRLAEAIRSVFKRGTFQDVTVARDGDVLIITVEERPTIGLITIDGNEDISDEDLKKGLSESGLGKGEVLNRSLLDKVTQELERQYFAQGKYGVKVEVVTETLPQNRVAITLKVNEGQVAKIRQVKLIGNTQFTDEELQTEFLQGAGNLWSFFSKNNQYSKQKFAADLETVRSFYQNRGFANFKILSTQVSITTDRKDVYLTVNLEEGDQYTIGEVKIAGETRVEKSRLTSRLFVASGALYARQNISASRDGIVRILGNDGYAFANVNVIPEVNETTKQVDLVFFVDAGKRAYVRRINFLGNVKTQDEVLRREMRLVEGGWLSNASVQRSKVRLERLGFFSAVGVETVPVPGTDDQVDLNFSVTEQPSGSVNVSLGGSSQGLVYQFGISQNNFLGTGNQVGITLNKSDATTNYSLSFSDPYFTLDGVSRSFSVYYRKTDASKLSITSYTTDSIGGSLSFGIPLDENRRLRLGITAEQTDIITGSSPSSQVRSFFADHGQDIAIDPTIGFETLSLTGSWSYDTRNRGLFPDAGSYHRINAEATIPVGDLQFYKTSYENQYYFPIAKNWSFLLRSSIAYGDGYGQTDTGVNQSLPFFESYFAGGGSTIRGFDDNSLGPRDIIRTPATEIGTPLPSSNDTIRIDNSAVGGNLRLVAGASLYFPNPFSEDSTSTRFSLFVDAGSAYNTHFDYSDYQELSATERAKIPDFSDIGRYRASSGVSFDWLSPLGLLSFSYAFPLKEQPEDVTRNFQFNIGSQF